MCQFSVLPFSSLYYCGSEIFFQKCAIIMQFFNLELVLYGLTFCSCVCVRICIVTCILQRYLPGGVFGLLPCCFLVVTLPRQLQDGHSQAEHKCHLFPFFLSKIAAVVLNLIYVFMYSVNTNSKQVKGFGAQQQSEELDEVKKKLLLSWSNCNPFNFLRYY